MYQQIKVVNKLYYFDPSSPWDLTTPLSLFLGLRCCKYDFNDAAAVPWLVVYSYVGTFSCKDSDKEKQTATTPRRQRYT